MINQQIRLKNKYEEFDIPIEDLRKKKPLQSYEQYFSSNSIKYSSVCDKNDAPPQSSTDLIMNIKTNNNLIPSKSPVLGKRTPQNSTTPQNRGHHCHNNSDPFNAHKLSPALIQDKDSNCSDSVSNYMQGKFLNLWYICLKANFVTSENMIQLQNSQNNHISNAITDIRNKYKGLADNVRYFNDYIKSTLSNLHLQLQTMNAQMQEEKMYNDYNQMLSLYDTRKKFKGRPAFDYW